MPHAICNTCGSLVHWPVSKGPMKKQSCACGGKDLQGMKGQMVGDEWQYTDKKGKVKKTEPVFHDERKPITL
jgi:hypothetical protein